MLVNGEDPEKAPPSFFVCTYISSFGTDAKMQLVLLLWEKFKNKAFPQSLYAKLIGCGVYRKKCLHNHPCIICFIDTSVFL